MLINKDVRSCFCALHEIYSEVLRPSVQNVLKSTANLSHNHRHYFPDFETNFRIMTSQRKMLRYHGIYYSLGIEL